MPAVGSLFLLDDYLHASMLAGHFPGDRQPWDLYSFIDDTNRAELLEHGLLPWWAHPELTVRFFRPLSSALIVLDHAIFGDAPLPMHLHSLAWWAAAVLGARALYRRVLAARAAWIAAAIFAIAPCHAMPLSWLANRDALLSLAFATWGLVFYTRWRDERRALDALWATILFALAFAAGEYALGFLGYVVAFELVRRGDGVGARVTGVLPFVAPGAVYMAIRTALHYGTRGSGFYSDPLSDPEMFFWLAPRRLASNLLLGWLALDPDTITYSYPTWAVVLAASTCAVLVVIAVRESLSTFDERARRATSWFLVGSVLALAPVLAVVPAPRTLGAAILGIAPAAAVVLDAAWFRTTPAAPGSSSLATSRPRWIRELVATVALAIAFCHLVRGPGEAWLLGRYHRGSSLRFLAQATSVAELTPERADADVVVARGGGAAFFIPFALGPGGPPRRHRILAQAGHVLVLRVDARTIDLIAPRDGGVYPFSEGNLFLDLRSDPAPGDVFEASGMRVTIQRVEAHRVLTARIEFDADLDDLTFLNETRQAYVLEEPPVIGFGAPFDSGPRPGD